MSTTFQLGELCARVDLPIRTVRYYIQEGLVDRPEGETRAARYGQRQLEQLLLIKKWTAAGLSLQRIRELLQGESAGVPERPRARGALEVLSRLHIADGVELLIDPGRAGLSPEQVRAFSRAVMQAFDAASVHPNDSAVTHPHQGARNARHPEDPMPLD